MLFDLRGKRRRAVQVTYAGLALLMAVGLVGAGVGSDVSGGVFDIFTGGDDGDISDANKTTQKKIDSANDKLKANPRDQAALIQVIRGHYTIAASDTDRETGEFGDEGKDELKKASAAWKRYLAAKPEKVDPALATLMMQAYGQTALNEPDNATEAAELVAEERNDATSYIQLVQFASLAGQKRKADLAADKALELAPKGEEKTVKQLLEQARQSAPAAPEGGAQAPAQPPVQGGG
ncbi:MAG TPA: hypothetical protein VF517_05385 [Thermoleophilaceae bacterium]|jgi:hypothetical protein